MEHPQRIAHTFEEDTSSPEWRESRKRFVEIQDPAARKRRAQQNRAAREQSEVRVAFIGGHPSKMATEIEVEINDIDMPEFAAELWLGKPARLFGYMVFKLERSGVVTGYGYCGKYRLDSIVPDKSQLPDEFTPVYKLSECSGVNGVGAINRPEAAQQRFLLNE